MKKIPLMLIALALLPATAMAQSVDVAALVAEGSGPFSREAGEQLWSREWQRDGGVRSCASCHGADLSRQGEHVRTGKLIEPLAPSANPERLSDPGKVAKWLRRNCKWTLGRECSAQEQGDLLSYIASR